MGSFYLGFRMHMQKGSFIITWIGEHKVAQVNLENMLYYVNEACVPQDFNIIRRQR